MRSVRLVFPLVVAAGALAAAPRIAAALDDCDSWDPISSFPDECPPPGACVDIVDDTTLSGARCGVYEDVQFKIDRSNVTLNCSNALLRGDKEGKGVAIRILNGGMPTQNVRVENCRIEGYRNGVIVRSSPTGAQNAEILRLYQRWFHNLAERLAVITAIGDAIRAAAPRGIELVNVHINDVAKDGLHIGWFVQDVSFWNGSVTNCDGVGVYMSYGSQANWIVASRLADNDREAVAMDGSAYNMIVDNEIHHNGDTLGDTFRRYPRETGITIFKNAWEDPYSANPRNQHATNNTIIRNRFTDHKVGVWIGYRMTVARDPDERGDPIYYDGAADGDCQWVPGWVDPLHEACLYFHKRAEDNIITDNEFYGPGRGIVVWDDGTTIERNEFHGYPGDAGAVEVGNRIRRKAGDPVRLTTLRDNRFGDTVANPIVLTNCSADNLVEGNVFLDGDPVTVDEEPCSRQRAALSTHVARADGFFDYKAQLDLTGQVRDGAVWLAGDVNADGIDDIVHVYESDDARTRVWTKLSTGAGFDYRSNFQTFDYSYAGGQWLLAQFDGVAGDDLLYVTRSERNCPLCPGGVNVLTDAYLWPAVGIGYEPECPPNDTALADPVGVGFDYDRPCPLGGTFLGAESDPEASPQWLAGDVNGDGRDDLVVVLRNAYGAADVRVHLALTGGGFAATYSSQVLGTYGGDYRYLMGDFDGDERDELAVLFPYPSGEAGAWVHDSTGDGFALGSWIQNLYEPGVAGPIHLRATDKWLSTDVEGDGIDDLVRVAEWGGEARVTRFRSNGSTFTAWGAARMLGVYRPSDRWLPGRFDPHRFADLVAVSDEESVANDLHHPDFVTKLADRDGYVATRTPAAATCSGSGLVDVNLFDGAAGQSVEALWRRHHMVGALETNSGSRYCTGTLIGRDLFLISSHCVDGRTRLDDRVRFNYERQTDGSGTNSSKVYDVVEVVEDGNGDADYAILRLANDPGDTFGWTRLQHVDPLPGERLAVIQHPGGGLKQVHTGPLSDHLDHYVRYLYIDTLPGSDGAGVIDSEGYLIGVHAVSGCAGEGAQSRGVRMSRLYDVSPTIRGIVDAPQANTPRGDVYVATSNGSAMSERGWKWHDFFCVNDEDCQVGDVNGDGKDDLVTIVPSTGDVYVAVSAGSGASRYFDGRGWRWGAGICRNRTCRLGDVDGDGDDDIVAFTGGSLADVYVAKSNRSSFGSAVRWHTDFCRSGDVCDVGDFNGDGWDDVVAFNRGSAGDVFVALSTRTFFTGTNWKWHDRFCYHNEQCRVGDVNGDGWDDIVAFTRGTAGDVFIATAYAYGFNGTGRKWHDKFCIYSEQCEVADVSGDGKADIVAFARGDAGEVFAATSDGARFNGTGWRWHHLFCLGSQICRLGDVDGNGKADGVVFLRNPL